MASMGPFVCHIKSCSAQQETFSGALHLSTFYAWTSKCKNHIKKNGGIFSLKIFREAAIKRLVLIFFRGEEEDLKRGDLTSLVTTQFQLYYIWKRRGTKAGDFFQSLIAGSSKLARGRFPLFPAAKKTYYCGFLSAILKAKASADNSGKNIATSIFS